MTKSTYYVLNPHSQSLYDPCRRVFFFRPEFCKVKLVRSIINGFFDGVLYTIPLPGLSYNPGSGMVWRR